MIKNVGQFLSQYFSLRSNCVGLYHENNRSDRDEYVELNLENTRGCKSNLCVLQFSILWQFQFHVSRSGVRIPVKAIFSGFFPSPNFLQRSINGEHFFEKLYRLINMSCHWSHITKNCLDWDSNPRPGKRELPWLGFEPQTWKTWNCLDWDSNPRPGKRGMWNGSGTATAGWIFIPFCVVLYCVVLCFFVSICDASERAQIREDPGDAIQRPGHAVWPAVHHALPQSDLRHPQGPWWLDHPRQTQPRPTARRQPHHHQRLPQTQEALPLLDNTISHQTVSFFSREFPKWSFFNHFRPSKSINQSISRVFEWLSPLKKSCWIPPCYSGAVLMKTNVNGWMKTIVNGWMKKLFEKTISCLQSSKQWSNTHGLTSFLDDP